ncbi:hypothetical protein N7535_005576 [Penicillium sp. DV-2018c]|nr:hypothetical protein N7535_005576 [Penicillium sp. DV-2018c]
MDLKSISEVFRATSDRMIRREFLNELLASLNPDEIRQVKSHVDNIKFQRDVLAELPLELAVMVIPYLNLWDLIVLRRVSKRWCELLTNTTVLSGVIKSHTGKNATHSETASLDGLIRNRIRAQRCSSAHHRTIPLALPSPTSNNKKLLSFFDCVCAWVAEDETELVVANLVSGMQKRLLTPNREVLLHVLVADDLISVISNRGYVCKDQTVFYTALIWHNRYCHVWRRSTDEYKYFRIPSTHFVHHVSHGSKVLLGYGGSVVHFCFDSGLTRTVETGMVILFVSLHPSEDRFSIISARNTSGNEFGLQEGHNVQVQKFSVHDDEFVCSWTQQRKIPCREKVWTLRRHNDQTPQRECLHPSQSSSLLWPPISNLYTMHLSLEVNDQITVHFNSQQSDHATNAHLDRPGQGSGLMCRMESGTSGELDTMLYIGHESSIRPSVISETNAVQFDAMHQMYLRLEGDRSEVVGDGDFLLFYSSHDDLEVWCFDKTWDPSRASDLWDNSILYF